MEDFIGRTDAATRIAKDAVCVAICDDEAFMLDLLEEKVKKMLPSGATKRFSSGRELLEDSTKVDVLLLDIQMPGMDGMETARLFHRQQRDTLIIFVKEPVKIILWILYLLSITRRNGKHIASAVLHFSVFQANCHRSLRDH